MTGKIVVRTSKIHALTLKFRVSTWSFLTLLLKYAQLRIGIESHGIEAWGFADEKQTGRIELRGVTLKKNRIRIE